MNTPRGLSYADEAARRGEAEAPRELQEARV